MSKKIEQLEFKLEKIIGIEKHAGKVRIINFLVIFAKIRGRLLKSTTYM